MGASVEIPVAGDGAGRLCVFDAYGTLFDIHSAVGRHTAPLGARAEALSQLWRSKQLEYSWVESLRRRTPDFWACTTAALAYAMAFHGIDDLRLRDSLLDAYGRLAAYPEAFDVLAALKSRGIRSAILSNGTPAMLADAVGSAGLGDLLSAVISVEKAGIFKPDPRVYALVTGHFGVQPASVDFHSSNAWDIAGAASFGFRTIWINRSGQPDEYGAAGGKVVRSLADIPSLEPSDAERST